MVNPVKDSWSLRLANNLDTLSYSIKVLYKLGPEKVIFYIMVLFCWLLVQTVSVYPMSTMVFVRYYEGTTAVFWFHFIKVFKFLVHTYDKLFMTNCPQ